MLATRPLPPRPEGSPLARHWDLDPDTVFLDHGSFGACPRVVLQAQSALRAELERQAVRLLHRELEPRLGQARAVASELADRGARTIV